MKFSFKKVAVLSVICAVTTFSGCSSEKDNTDVEASSASVVQTSEASQSADKTAGQELTLSNEVVKDTSWIASGDGSCMMFSGEDEFAWYLDKSVTDDNYYKGTYKFYMGESALQHITVDLADYGVTEDEMYGVFEKNEQYSLDNFVCMTVMNNSFMMDGEEKLTEPKPTSYFGFMLEDGTYLDIANMGTGTYYGFTKE